MLTMIDVLKACGDIGEFVANLLGIGTEDWAVAPGWPPKKIKDEGGSSGGSGGKSKFQSPTEANLSASDLPTSGVPKGVSSFGNLGRTGGGLSSLGSGAVNQGGINSFERVVANWSSLSDNTKANLNLIALTPSGQRLIDNFEITGLKITINDNKPWGSFGRKGKNGLYPAGLCVFPSFDNYFKEDGMLGKFIFSYHPYIVIANDLQFWDLKDDNNNTIDDLYTLAHELGHFDLLLSFFNPYIINNFSENHINCLGNYYKINSKLHERWANGYRECIKTEIFFLQHAFKVLY